MRAELVIRYTAHSRSSRKRGGNPLILLQKRVELAICQDSHNDEGTVEETNQKKNAG